MCLDRQILPVAPPLITKSSAARQLNSGSLWRRSANKVKGSVRGVAQQSSVGMDPFVVIGREGVKVLDYVLVLSEQMEVRGYELVERGLRCPVEREGKSRWEIGR